MKSGAGIFLISSTSKLALEPTQPGDLSPGLKRPGREANRPPMSKTMWSYATGLRMSSWRGA